MKHIFIQLFALLHLLPGALAADGPFATAAEFGSPRLNLDPVQYFTPSEIRTWPHPFSKPETGRLVGLNPHASPLHGILERKDGSTVAFPLMTTDDDIQAVVNKWKEDNKIIPLSFYAHNSRLVRLLAIYASSDNKMIYAHTVSTLGETYSYPIPNEEVSAAVAKSVSYLYYVHPETLKILREEVERRKNAPIPDNPLPVAENANEALLYVLRRAVSIVYLQLNRRGSTADLAFRELLKDKKLVSAWAQRHVFLIAYADDDGLYHPELEKELGSLSAFLEGGVGTRNLPPTRPDTFRGPNVYYHPGCKVQPFKTYTTEWRYRLDKPLKHDFNLFVNKDRSFLIR